MTGNKWLVTAIAAGCLITATGANAVHDEGLFELDGNVADPVVGLPDDWQSIYMGGDSAFAKAFITDGVREEEASFFTGGGSKDTRPISSGSSHWEWKGCSAGDPDCDVSDVVPDKDDIEHAFAAAYVDPASGDTIFYFGADRFDAGDGSAEIGFWFFRQSVTLNPIPAGETVGTFNGMHRDGDILVLADFVAGGAVAEINVYKWTGDDATGGPVLLLTTSDADCAAPAGPADDRVCMTANVSAGETPPWPYLNKDGAGSFQSVAMVEGGINVSQLLGGEVGCFSSFMAETRSSGSAITAQLKDFALGGFPVCSVAVDKTGGELSKKGDTVTYSVTIHNTGRATLYPKTITDSLVGDLMSYCPNPLAADDGVPGGTDECSFTYTRTVASTDPDPLDNKISVVYTEGPGPEYGGVAVSDDDGHVVNLFQPRITLSKVASPTTLLQGGTVNYTITLSNASSADTPTLGCTLTDANLGVATEPQLEFGDDETVLAQITFGKPDEIPWCTYDVATDRYLCANKAEATCYPAGFSNKLYKKALRTVTIIPAAAALTVTKVGDEWSKAGDIVSYTVRVTNISNIPVTITRIDDDLVDGDAVPGVGGVDYNVVGAACRKLLAPDEFCEFVYTYTVQAGDPNPLPNTIRITAADDAGGEATAQASWSVKLVAPSLEVSKTCIPGTTPTRPGDYVSFRIDTENTGTADLLLDLDDTLLGKLADDVALSAKDGSCEFGNVVSDAADGCLRVEEQYQVPGPDDVVNVVTASWRMAEKYGLPNTGSDTATSMCEVDVYGATRTLGFWKTHGSDGDRFLPPKYPEPVAYGYTCYVANGIGYPIDLGWKQLMDCGDVFGVFWSSKAQCDKPTQARFQASWQFLAAILNYEAFGTPIGTCATGIYKSMTMEQLFEAMRLALATNNTTAMRRLQGIFGCYNESGDDVSIVDTVPVPPADPNGTRSEADALSCK